MASFPAPDADAFADTSRSTVSLAPRTHLKIYDVAKTVAIISVVYVHSFVTQYIQDPEGIPLAAYRYFNWLVFFVGLFVMQGLFFSSGYLFSYTNGYARAGGYWRFLFKKVQRLIVPYWALTTAAFLAKGVFGRHAARPVAFTWAEYFDGLLYPKYGPIVLAWFLSALMLMFLAAPLFDRAARMPVWAWAALTAVFAGFYYVNVLDYIPLHRFLQSSGLAEQAPFSWLFKTVVDEFGREAHHSLFAFTEASSYVLYFWLGVLAYRYQSAWQRILQRRRVALAALLVNLAGLALWANNAEWKGLYEKLTCLLGPTGFLMLFGCAAWYVREGKRFLDGVFRFSFTIYLTSWFFQQAIFVGTRFLFARLTLSANAMMVVSFTLLFAGGVLGPVLLGYLARKWRIPGRFLIGA